jgi:hypothetical protein
MEHQGSLQCSQEPVTGPYPEPHKSNPYPATLFLRFILILSSHLRLGHPSDLFPSDFPTKILLANRVVVVVKSIIIVSMFPTPRIWHSERTLVHMQYTRSASSKKLNGET